MIINVKAFARFREAFGKERDIELDGTATIEDLLTGLCALHDSHELIFDESGMLKKYDSRETLI